MNDQIQHASGAQISAAIKTALKQIEIRRLSVELAAKFQTDDPVGLARKIHAFIGEENAA
jgi:hypothetical protein